MIAGSYRILLHPDVLALDSKRFDRTTKDKIKSKCLELLSRHPDEAGERLKRELFGYRKLKVFNDYRVVYHVDRKRKEVLILSVGIRRNQEVYREALKRLKALLHNR